ncbi:MAG: hypothetical protein Q9222_004859 [Ikaeria aurantiellina]
MVSKPSDGEHRWLFPESFNHVVKTQEAVGGWDIRGSCESRILTTLAALLAYTRHNHTSLVRQEDSTDHLRPGILQATEFLQAELQQWDVQASNSVAFEILIPTHMKMLEQEGIFFHFPHKRLLTSLHEKKLAKFDPMHLYGNQQTTLLHSLEAFIGKIDFDRVRHQLTFGSMLGSPSSTAAYLIKCSTWDTEAETYLKDAIASSGGHGDGGVPSVYPCNIFELTWIATTLLLGGFPKTSFSEDTIAGVISYLDDQFESQTALTGFGILADADDTARTLLTLSLLGHPKPPDQMLSHFKQNGGPYMTYVGERDPSFSANCNVLLAVLHTAEPGKYNKEIERVVVYLCDVWADGPVKDKWALMQLLRLWDDDTIELSLELVRDRVSRTLIQLVNRTLFAQDANGAWGSAQDTETSSYSVLTLLALQDLPQVRPLAWKIRSSIQTGRQYLAMNESQWTKPRRLWIEKVTYGSKTLAEGYCLAAMHAPALDHKWTSKIETINCTHTKQITMLTGFVSGLPVYSEDPAWMMLASVIEGCSYLPQLRSIRSEIFPHQKSSKDTYLNFIPMTWTLSNNRLGLFLPATLLWDMMVMSMLDYLIDEYMESAVAELPEQDLVSLRGSLQNIFQESKAGSLDHTAVPELPNGMQQHQESLNESKKRKLDNALSNGDRASPIIQLSGQSASPSVAAASKVLTQYIESILNHQSVLSASGSSHNALRRSLINFLDAHIVQIHDNNRLRSQEPSNSPTTEYLTPPSDHYTWTNGTAALHTSGPLSFAFYICLLEARSDATVFPTAYQKYLSSSLCAHLSAMTRLYNDYGSIARDKDEGNLNSVNFPEFHHPQGGEKKEAKMQLLKLARFERDSLGRVLAALKDSLLERDGGRRGKEVADAMALFTAVAEFYADIYVARDLTNTTK